MIVGYLHEDGVRFMAPNVYRDWARLAAKPGEAQRYRPVTFDIGPSRETLHQRPVAALGDMMACTVHHIRGDRQTGKTTMALGFLERLGRERITRGLYVAPSRMRAAHWARRTSVACIGAIDLHPDTVAGRTAVVVDDCDELRPEYVERVADALEYLKRYKQPTQLVLVDWPQDRWPLRWPT